MFKIWGEGQYINKKILVAGGRNSGAVAACYLHDLGCKVSLLEIKDKIQAKEKYKQWLKKRNIEIYTSSIINKLIGDKELKKAEINRNGRIEEIRTDGVFFYTGRVPLFNFANIKVETDKEGYIFVDVHNETSINGLFAAGDIIPKLKQIITACGDGANAYYFANKYIQRIKKIGHLRSACVKLPGCGKYPAIILRARMNTSQPMNRGRNIFMLSIMPLG